MKVNIYIDGFNFYHGLKANQWKKYYWLDVVTLFEHFIKEGQELNILHYFSAEPIKRGQKQRQSAFFSANRSNKKFKLILGKFLEKEVTAADGTLYKTFEEKETDVNIAVQMIEDVIFGKCDKTILVSGDSDLAAPIKFIRKFKPDHQVVVMFPPQRFSNKLKGLCTSFLSLKQYEGYFKKSLFDNGVKMTNGKMIYKPEMW